MSDQPENGPRDVVSPDDVDPGTGGVPGGFDLGGILSAAQGMQERMASAAAEIAAAELTGTSGGGKVQVTVSGAWEFQSVRIAADVIDPEDPSMLEDLVLAALRDAANQVVAANDAVNPMAGLDLGGLGGLFGGS